MLFNGSQTQQSAALASISIRLLWKQKHVLTAALREASVDDGASGLSESPVSFAEASAEGFRSLTGAILPGLRPLTWQGGTSAVCCHPGSSMRTHHHCKHGP